MLPTMSDCADDVISRERKAGGCCFSFTHRRVYLSQASYPSSVRCAGLRSVVVIVEGGDKIFFYVCSVTEGGDSDGGRCVVKRVLNHGNEKENPMQSGPAVFFFSRSLSTKEWQRVPTR